MGKGRREGQMGKAEGKGEEACACLPSPKSDIRN
jgi:hypothetical protein